MKLSGTSSRRSPSTRSLTLILLAALAFALTATSVAWALTELSQKPGQAGCISEDGTAGDPKTEPPTVCQDGRGLDEPFDVAVSLDGRNVYVASLGDQVAVLERNPVTGELKQLEGLAGCIAEDGTQHPCQDGKAIRQAASVAVSPNGKSVYVVGSLSDAVAIFERDPATGALQQLNGTAGCLSNDGTAGPGGTVGECQKGTALEGARTVVVSPDGKNVYVTAQGSKAVAIFGRNQGGELEQFEGKAGCISEDGSGGACQDGTGLDEAFAMAISRDGKNLYVTSLGASNAIAVFDRGPEGELLQKEGAAACISETSAGCTPARAIDGPFGVAVSPDGKNVYVAANFEAVGILNRAPDGGLSQQPGAAGCVSEGGKGGCQTGVALRSPFAVAVNPDGESVYVSSSLSGAIAVFDRSTATGGLRQKEGAAGCFTESALICRKGTAINDATGITTSPDGANIYVAAGGSGAVAIFDRVTSTPPTPPVSRPKDTLAPGVSGFKLAPSRFRSAPQRGSQFRFLLSEPASVAIQIERAHRSRDGVHFTTRATLSYAGRPAGESQVRFTGRIAKRALGPGRYRASLVATDAAGNSSAPQRAGFTVLAPRR